MAGIEIFRTPVRRAGVQSPGAMKTPDHSHPSRRRTWRDYLPLLLLVVVAGLFAWAKARSYGPDASSLHGMHDFMGFFLVVFALLKLFDLRGFADGFQMYDLLAQRSRTYALVYPFLELALGLAYLAFWRPVTVYAATIALLLFGALGVIRALARGLDVNCACMGNTLKVPLSTVALTEDLGMVGMAAALWLRVH
jgi:hypothetical protein